MLDPAIGVDRVAHAVERRHRAGRCAARCSRRHAIASTTLVAKDGECARDLVRMAISPLDLSK